MVYMHFSEWLLDDMIGREAVVRGTSNLTSVQERDRIRNDSDRGMKHFKVNPGKCYKAMWSSKNGDITQLISGRHDLESHWMLESTMSGIIQATKRKRQR